MSELYSMLKAKKTGASSGGGGGATVNNATITIQKNGTTVDSFTSNQATDKTINITVPTSAADVSAIPTTAKGANSGVAELDANGKIPSSQLPSYVDDVIEGYYYDSKFYEDSEHTTEITGTTGKIYVDLSTNKTYRWSGSGYTEISESLALGETSSTAYRGDRGKTAYGHATDSSRHTTAETSGLYKIATTAEGHIASVESVQKSDITGLGIPEQDTTVGSGIVLTGYPSESPAQSDTIDETDTVNEAIKKLDERSRVDENNISNVQTSLAVGSSDDGKVLTASYSGGTGSYAWVTPSGGDVTGVKGSGETNYRTGNVSLSAANVGAIPTTEKGANGGVAALDSNGKIAADKIAAGALANGMTATTQETSDDSTKLATTAFVHDVVDSLPSPMVYKGTLGTGGTITTLPVDGTAEVGDTYKVITDGTYASQAAKIGDMFICLTKATSSNTWSYVPSGDDTDVTQVSAGTGLTTASGSPITTTGTIKAKLKSSTALAEAATNSTTTGKSYAVNVDSAGDLACNVPWTDTTYTFNTAYNASTNKAATMSDITTSAENGTLTGYEKKTGNVAATDKIVEAIGKLETKADTNKTNILSAYGGIIGKNVVKQNTVTFTGQNKEILCAPISGYITLYVGNCVSTDTDASTCGLIIDYVDGGSSIIISINRGTSTVVQNIDLGSHVAKNISMYSSDNYVHGAGDTATFTDIMICSQANYIADSSYQPYVMSNAEITAWILSHT